MLKPSFLGLKSAYPHRSHFAVPSIIVPAAHAIKAGVEFTGSIARAVGIVAVAAVRVGGGRSAIVMAAQSSGAYVTCHIVLKDGCSRVRVGHHAGVGVRGQSLGGTPRAVFDEMLVAVAHKLDGCGTSSLRVSQHALDVKIAVFACRRQSRQGRNDSDFGSVGVQLVIAVNVRHHGPPAAIGCQVTVHLLADAAAANVDPEQAVGPARSNQVLAGAYGMIRCAYDFAAWQWGHKTARDAHQGSGRLIARRAAEAALVAVEHIGTTGQTNRIGDGWRAAAALHVLHGSRQCIDLILHSQHSRRNGCADLSCGEIRCRRLRHGQEVLVQQTLYSR
eukprot:m.294738 g.294738  ORF g.294738 m.294738 type:complete len:333 (-) comp22966_c2_seq9:852-1850(-)